MRVYWCLFFSLFFIGTTTYAQTWRAKADTMTAVFEAQGYDQCLLLGATLKSEIPTQDSAYANLLYQIGYAHFMLQQYSEAIALAKEERSVRAEQTGRNSDQYMGATRLLGIYHTYVGDFASAVPLLDEVVAHYTGTLGPTHKDVLTIRLQLASIVQQTGDLSRTDALYGSLYKDLKANYEVTDSLYQVTSNAASAFYYSIGNYEKAEPFFKDAISAMRKQFGKHHNYFLQSYNSFGEFYLYTGMYKKAFKVFKELAELNGEVHGMRSVDRANALYNQAVTGEYLERYEETALLYREVLSIEAEIHGPESQDYALTLTNFGQIMYALDSLDQSLSAFETAKDIYEKHDHPDPENYPLVLDNLIIVLSTMEDYETAEQVSLERIAMAKDSMHTAVPALQQLIDIYQQLGRNGDVVSTYQEILHIQETAYGKGHEYGKTLVQLGNHYFYQDQPETGFSYLEQAVALYESAHLLNADYVSALEAFANTTAEMDQLDKGIQQLKRGVELLRNQPSDSAHYHTTLSMLAMAYWTHGKLDKADSTLQARTVFLVQQYGANDTLHAINIYHHGRLMMERGDLGSCRDKFKTSAKILAKTNGKRDEQYLTVLSALANVEMDLGNFKEARRLYQQLERLQFEVHGRNHPDYVTCLSNYALFHVRTGAYETAVKLASEALTIHGELYPDGHVDDLYILGHLSNAYRGLQDYGQAEAHLLKARQLAQKLLPDEHPQFATLYNNLASLYGEIGQYDKAETLYKKALTETERIYGKDHHEYANTCNNFGTLLLYQATIKKDVESFQNLVSRAKEQFNSALEVDKKLYGADHIELATYHNNLAEAHRMLNETEVGISHYERALELEEAFLGKHSATSATTRHNLAIMLLQTGEVNRAKTEVEKAIEIKERVFGKGHASMGEVLGTRGLIYERLGETEKALADMRASIAQRYAHVERNFTYMSESERQQYLQSTANVVTIFQDFAMRQIAETPDLAWDLLDIEFRNKGMLLRSSDQLKQRIYTSGDTGLIQLYDDWRLAKKELSAYLSKPIDQRPANFAALEDTVNTFEKQLSLRSQVFGEPNKAPGVKALKDHLGRGEALVEFTHFSTIVDSTLEDQYFALILIGGEDRPKVVRIATAGQLTDVIHTAGNNTLTGVETIYGKRGALNPRLYDLIWRPLSEELSQVTKVSIVPSGLLHRVAFHAMAYSSDTALAQQLDLRRFSGAVSLLDQQEDWRVQESMVTLFGGIQYNSEQSTTEVWKYLPGTQKEVKTIASTLEKSGIENRVYLGLEADEKTLKQDVKKGTDILHMATHGFFYSDQNTIQAEEVVEVADLEFRGSSRGDRLVSSSDPMIRSGLVFARANDVWNEQNFQSEDGVLTAYEASLLDLSSVRLLVMSACETGLGDVLGDEGVYGLQRAFKIAGVDQLLMSLWQVPDKETEEFMTFFYQRLMETSDVQAAFVRTQRHMSEQYDPYFWAGFVLMH